MRKFAFLAAAAAIVALGLGLAGMLPFGGRDEPVSPTPPGEATPNVGGDLAALVDGLAARMAGNPADGEGWLLLARTYGELHRHREAADAYARAALLLPPDANLLADWADAHVMAHDRRWDDAARAIVQRALKADPAHLKALALAGSAAFERADYPAAIGYWQRMQAAAPAGSMNARLAAANIDEARAKQAGKRPAAPDAAAPAVAAAAPGAAIVGTVTLAAALRGKVAPGDTVFVFAKAADAAGPPLAVKRFTAAAFPLAFRLDESDAVMPGRSLSGHDEVLLTARISKSGNAAMQPGDISSAAVRVKVGNAGVRLELGAAR